MSKMMNHVESDTLRIILKYRLIQPGDKVLLGVSGGSDSLGLLYILKALESDLKCELAAAHLDHQLRQDSSKDREFVENQAQLLGLPFFAAKADIRRLAEEKGQSLEEAARGARYRFLAETAMSISANKIAVAHTKDDQAETMMLHLTRGAGMDGLEAMSLIRPLGRVDLIRPFLLMEKAQIRMYLEYKKINWREDISNGSLEFKRNKIRNLLIPMIQKEFNPQIVDSLSRLSQIFADENAYLTEQTQKVLSKIVRKQRSMVSFPVKEFQKLDRALQRRLIRELFRLFYPHEGLSYFHVENVITLVNESQSGRRVAVGSGLSAWKESDALIFGQYREIQKIEPETIDVPGEKVISGKGVKLKVSLRKCPRDDFMDVSKSAFSFREVWNSLQSGKTFHFCEYFDAGKMDASVIVRTRLTGDLYDPIGLGKVKKLKEIYVDEKIPLRYRTQVPVFVNGGKIFWIGGYRISESFKVDDSTHEVLEVKLQLEGISL